jgi:tRNA1(Val) A37 N6-methylase TrmN6
MITRDTAKREGPCGLAAWIDAARHLAKPRGTIVLIHRADRLDEVLARLRERAGAIEIIPLWPRVGEAAKRVIVRARTGARGPTTLLPGLVLHQADGAYTEAAEAILRAAAAL